MNPEIAQGVAVELHSFLKGDWIIAELPDRFVLTLKSSSLAGKLLQDHIWDAAWDLAKFMAYRPYVSIAENVDGSITIVSKMRNGDGFEVVLRS